MSANGRCQHCGRADVTVRTRAGFGGNPRRPLVPIDACIAQLVDGLNRGGITTLGACCGHGKGPGSILLADGREIAVHERWESARPPVRIVASAAEASSTMRQSVDSGLRRLESYLRSRLTIIRVLQGVVVGTVIGLVCHGMGWW